MTPQQHRFIERIAYWIPRLFEAIEQGNEKSEVRLGTRQIEDRQVVIKLIAEVIDISGNK